MAFSSMRYVIKTVSGQVRIIGGRWRGTRLSVPDIAGLRPSGDRVRETLFNWLMPHLPSARVLDLFAGSGALGLEAVSRGAASAVLVERERPLAISLQNVVNKLTAQEQVQVAQADALQWLKHSTGSTFDIVFIDPPFADNLWDKVMQVLPERLSTEAWIYVETPVHQTLQLPSDWQLHRQGKTSQVCYALYQRGTATLST